MKSCCDITLAYPQPQPAWVILGLSLVILGYPLREDMQYEEKACINTSVIPDSPCSCEMHVYMVQCDYQREALQSELGRPPFRKAAPIH